MTNQVFYKQENQFTIGETVRVKKYEDIPSDRKVKSSLGDPSLVSPKKSALCGCLVEIVDRIYSERYGVYIYRVKDIEAKITSRSEFTEDLLESVEQPKYSCEIEDAGSVIIATIYEEANGVKRLVAKNHGHVIHEGVLGYTQALSYALKKAYQRLQEEEECRKA